jgi:hypothetical protein
MFLQKLDILKANDIIKVILQTFGVEPHKIIFVNIRQEKDYQCRAAFIEGR